MGSGTATYNSNTVLLVGIRILGDLMIFLYTAGFGGLPWTSVATNIVQFGQNDMWGGVPGILVSCETFRVDCSPHRCFARFYTPLVFALFRLQIYRPIQTT